MSQKVDCGGIQSRVISIGTVLLCRRRYARADDEYTENDDVTCLPRCRGDVTFRAVDKRFAATWQIVWASVSLSSSLVTVLTVVVDSTRFRYPERPVVFVAICRCYITSRIEVTSVYLQGRIEGSTNLQGW